MVAHKEISTFRKITTLCIRLLFIAFLTLVLLLVVQILKNPEQPPSILDYQPFTVLSNSMNPTFETGDMVIVKSAVASEINVNDVITFKEGSDKYITHRVVEITEENNKIGFVTKGDNNNVNDGDVVTPEAIVGKLVLTFENAGFIAKFASGPIGFMLLIIIPLTGYVCIVLYERIKRSYNSGKLDT